jgi:hypothetical protein
MWPSQTATLVVTEFYTDDRRSLHSIDAEESATPLATCSQLPSLLSSSSLTDHCGSSSLRLSRPSKDSRFKSLSSYHLSPYTSLKSLLKLACIEPAKLLKPGRPAPKFKNFQQATRSPIKTTAEPIEVDLGSNEAVSNAQLHALELEYQQEQFEQSQREKQQKLQSFDSAPVYYACLNSRPASRMETNRERPPPVKRIKLINEFPIKATQDATQRSKETTPNALKPSRPPASLPGVVSKGDDKLKRKRSASFNLDKLPIQGPLSGESAERIVHELFGKEDFERALQEHDISIEIFKDGVKTGPTIEKHFEAPKLPTKVHMQTEVQTMDRPLTGIGTETEKEEVKEYRDEEAQYEVEEPEQEIAIWKVDAFDQAPLQRRHQQREESILDGIDLSIMIQPRIYQPTFLDAQTSCGDEERQDKAIGTEARVVKEESMMTDEAVAIESPAQVGCSHCQFKQVDELEEGEVTEERMPNLEEAEALDALTSLSTGTVANASFGEALKVAAAHDCIEGDDTMDWTGQPGHYPAKDEGGADSQENAQFDTEDHAQSTSKSSHNTLKEDVGETTSARGRRKSGGHKRTAEEKEEEARVRAEWFPPRRTIRTTKEVNYKESGRSYTSKEKVEDSPKQETFSDDSKSWNGRRTSGRLQNIEAISTTSTHPKMKRKRQNF